MCDVVGFAPKLRNCHYLRMPRVVAQLRNCEYRDTNVVRSCGRFLQGHVLRLEVERQRPFNSATVRLYMCTINLLLNCYLRLLCRKIINNLYMTISRVMTSP